MIVANVRFCESTHKKIKSINVLVLGSNFLGEGLKKDLKEKVIILTETRVQFLEYCNNNGLFPICIVSKESDPKINIDYERNI